MNDFLSINNNKGVTQLRNSLFRNWLEERQLSKVLPNSFSIVEMIGQQSKVFEQDITGDLAYLEGML